jgi:uncharacterized protein YhaN
MKLRTLDLRAFGSLRDVSLSFTDDAPRLHVVYGPNEAGKSTALRALTGLFFGIAHNTRDAHSIAPTNLRVGALLRDARGRERYVLRRKGRKGTLLAEDESPLPPEEEAWVNVGMHATAFETQFGLTFETLHRGAEELLGSGGDLGQSLFAAALNGGQVRRVLAQLEEEAEALFRRNGVKLPLNAAIAQFEEAKKASRELATKADVFEQQQSEVESALAACAAINARLGTLRAERAKLERVKNILPLVARQRARQAERQALGQVARLPAEAGEERKRAVTARREAQVRLEHAEVELQRLHEQRQALQQAVLPALASLPVRSCEALRDRLSVYREGLRKQLSRSDALTRARAEVERARQALDVELQSLESIERLRLPKNIEARARDQLRKGELARAEVLSERRKLDDVRQQLHEAQTKLRQLWAAEQPHKQLSLLDREGPRAVALTEELCRDFEQRFDKLDDKQSELELKRQGWHDQLEQHERQQAELSSRGAPPSEDDLSACREQRDAALTELRDLLQAQPDVPRAVAYVERAQARSAQADALADHMRREADRVATAAQLAAAVASIKQNLKRSQTSLDQLRKRSDKTQAEWAAVFRSAGLPVRLPREALRLVVTQRELELLCESLERQQTKNERAYQTALAAESGWTERWRELAKSLDLPLPKDSATSTAELEALLSARTDLLQRHDAAVELERELAGVSRDLSAFRDETRELCAAHMPELAEQPAEVAAERLIAAHQRTQAALSQLQKASEAAEMREQAAQDARRELAHAERHIQQLMQAAGVDDPSQLEEAERRSARARDLDAELANDASDLAEQCEGVDPEQVVAEVGLSSDHVRVRLMELEEEYERLDAERFEQSQQLTSKQMGLSHLHEQHRAGDAAGDAALHLEEVRELSESYARLRLAASLLRREIVHYRERNRGPVLTKAAAWFARLTLGTFSGLDIDYDDRDQPILQCVRADAHRSRLHVPALSTGTRDQLFLALRLASIEHLGTQRELMPLILDDILVHFDDARARAALAALADFASTTQVIFFTHHEHLCELAREAVPSQQLQIQRLPQAPVLTQLAIAPS